MIEKNREGQKIDKLKLLNYKNIVNQESKLFKKCYKIKPKGDKVIGNVMFCLK